MDDAALGGDRAAGHDEDRSHRDRRLQRDALRHAAEDGSRSEEIGGEEPPLLGGRIAGPHGPQPRFAEPAVPVLVGVRDRHWPADVGELHPHADLLSVLGQGHQLLTGDGLRQRLHDLGDVVVGEVVAEVADVREAIRIDAQETHRRGRAVGGNDRRGAGGHGYGLCRHGFDRGAERAVSRAAQAAQIRCAHIRPDQVASAVLVRAIERCGERRAEEPDAGGEHQHQDQSGVVGRVARERANADEHRRAGDTRREDRGKAQGEREQAYEEDAHGHHDHGGRRHQDGVRARLAEDGVLEQCVRLPESPEDDGEDHDECDIDVVAEQQRRTPGARGCAFELHDGGARGHPRRQHEGGEREQCAADRQGVGEPGDGDVQRRAA